MKKIGAVLSGVLLLSSIAPVKVLASSKVDTILNNMTLRQKISQMLMPDFRKWKQENESQETNFTVMNDEVKSIVEEYDFGGVILFAENVKTTPQTLKLTTDLQSAATSDVTGNVPLFLGIDQEGGVVYRLGSGTALPGNMAIAATRNSQYAYDAGNIIGKELNALGINTNFAPVLDVNNNPKNPVINLRSFGDNPALVGEYGGLMMKGMQDNNISTSAKHFPGHGDTAVDSHTGLPLVNKTKQQLMEVELAPFKDVMNKGVDMLMTAHIQYPQVDDTKVISKKDNSEIYLPATLSKEIMTNLVRNELNYNGIIISDAMNMKAIADHFGEKDATLKAIEAGVDIVLMPVIIRSKADMVKIDEIIDYVEHGVTTGIITEARLNDSVRRILSLKEKRGILDYANDTRTYDEKLAVAKQVVGSQENRDKEREIAAAAVTVVKNKDDVLPFHIKEDSKILLLGAYNNELPGMELSVKRLMAEGKIPTSATYKSIRFSKDTNFENDLKAEVENATHVIVISEISREARLAQDFWLTKIPTQVVDYSNEKNIPVAVMSIAHPYDADNYPNAKAHVTVYGAKGMDPTENLRPDVAFGPNIPAGVEVILGRDALGTLPVNLPKISNALYTEEVAYPFGHGLRYKNPLNTFVLNVNEKVLLGEEVTINLPTNLDGLENYEYSFEITYNKAVASVEGSDGKVVLQKGQPFVFKTLKETVDAVIESVVLVDHKMRRHTLPFTSMIESYVLTAVKDENLVVEKPTFDLSTLKENTIAKKDVDTSDVTMVYVVATLISLLGYFVLKHAKK